MTKKTIVDSNNVFFVILFNQEVSRTNAVDWHGARHPHNKDGTRAQSVKGL
jgi:hypothetical protein